MLSIIISSYKPDLFKNLSKSISDTIGVEYEIIKIDNPGLMGICKAYNIGASQAKYEYLLFLHEDVLFQTKNWGELLINELRRKDTGVVGLAGAKKKFDMCYGYDPMLPEYGILYVRDKEGNPSTFKNYPDLKVRVVDGVFMGVKKEVFEKFKFNDSINGFHFYDIDFCLRVAEVYQNYVCKTIEIVHLSNGNFGNDWMKSLFRFYKTKTYHFDIPTASEKKRIRRAWYKRLKNENIKFLLRLQYVVKLGFDKHSYDEMINFLMKKA